MKVFLDIDIGDAAKYHQQLECYNRATEFLAITGSQYGMPNTIQELDEEQRQLLADAYQSDKTWSSKGEFLLDEPAPLRAGRIVIELYDREVPKTAENFRCLCTGEKGVGKNSRKPLHYKGTKFHRIVKGFVCQGGDIVRGDGSGGDSIYGGKFNDEKEGLKLKHDAVGVVGMANSGKQVVVGAVAEGQDILRRIDEEAASADGTPRLDVTIADCGVLE